LRSCSSPSSPSSSGAVSGSNGFEAVSNGWYSLAIKPEKMRNHGGEEKERTGARTKEKRQNRGVRRGETEPGKILVHQPAAPRAFTTIVSVLEGEDRTEN